MRALVVDPGGDVERILAAIDQTGVDVERILLTHGHLDHAGGAAASPRRCAPARTPERCRSKVPTIATRSCWKASPRRPRVTASTRANVTPGPLVPGGRQVALGPHRFDILHCPGHTPGHVVFVNHAARFALVGDVLFQGSVGRTDFPVWRSRCADRRDQDEVAAARGRFFVPVRSRSGLDHRRGAADQSFPAPVTATCARHRWRGQTRLASGPVFAIHPVNPRGSPRGLPAPI